jgi:preprotein translocase subunit YajC
MAVPMLTGTRAIQVWRSYVLQLTTTAYAADAAPQGNQGLQGVLGNYSFIILMVVTIAIFYFLLIRPQKKKEKERMEMISALKKGDKVMTAGGMYGVIDSFKEGDIVVVKVSGNTKIEFAKSAIQTKVQ